LSYLAFFDSFDEAFFFLINGLWLPSLDFSLGFTFGEVEAATLFLLLLLFLLLADLAGYESADPLGSSY